MAKPGSSSQLLKFARPKTTSPAGLVEKGEAHAE
jgi:hypothetical protein